MKLTQFIAGSCVLSSMLLSFGCSGLVNAHSQKTPMMADYLAGRHEPVQAVLDEKLEPPGIFNASTVGSGDEIMWRLEAGTFNYLIGKPDVSLIHFERAEALMADFDARAMVNLRQAGAESAVLFTNLNALPYRGLCRDRIMLPVFKAFDYLAKNDEAGFRVELFNLRERQDQVLADYRKFFQTEDEALKQAKTARPDAAAHADPGSVLSHRANAELNANLAETTRIAHRGYGNFLNPFAIFLSGYGYMRDHDFQNAVVDYARLHQAMPAHPLVRQYYVTALHKAGREIPAELRGTPPLTIAPERNSVLVVFANGRSAAFRQIALYIPVILPGYATVATTAWPVCEYYPAPYQALHVEADGQTVRTQTIADMDGILSQEYTERLPGMLTRVILSTAVKEIGSYLATRAAAEADEWAGVAAAIGTAAYKVAVNTADTRSWELLPKEFQIAQIAMPRDRRLKLAPDGKRPLTVTIPDSAQSAIVYVNAPGNAEAAFSGQVFPLLKQ